jgi:hypothetical protein
MYIQLDGINGVSCHTSSVKNYIQTNLYLALENTSPGKCVLIIYMARIYN